ncbi:MAG: type II secretion system protein M [Pseudomonadota bacterium]
MRVIRIIRTPALEAALARFDGWWGARSHRERVMLAGLAVLLAGLILVFGVIGPLQNARARALADIRTYETLNARLRAAGPLAPRRGPARTGAPAQVVSESAASFGLAPRVEQVPGGVRAVIVDASYETLMAWLGDLGATSKLRVRSVALQRGTAAGHVSATIGFGA